MCSGQIFVIALELVARRTSPKKNWAAEPGRTYFWEIILVNGEEWIVPNS